MYLSLTKAIVSFDRHDDLVSSTTTNDYRKTSKEGQPLEGY